MPDPDRDPIQTSAEAMEGAALPRARAVHADPGTRGAESEPLPEGMLRKPQKQKSPAEWAYQRLVLYIQNFEKQLDAEEEVAMGFVGGAHGVMRIEGMGYFDPDIVTFYGRDPIGARMQLVQHVTQLNVQLRATQKPRADEDAVRIGFRLAAALDDDDEADAGPGDPAADREPAGETVP